MSLSESWTVNVSREDSREEVTIRMPQQINCMKCFNHDEGDMDPLGLSLFLLKLKTKTENTVAK